MPLLGHDKKTEPYIIENILFYHIVIYANSLRLAFFLNQYLFHIKYRKAISEIGISANANENYTHLIEVIKNTYKILITK